MTWGALQQNERMVTLTKRILSISDKQDQTAYDRVGQWQRGLDKFALNPAGSGLGTAGTASFYHGGASGEATIFDGGWFRVLAEQGIPGWLCGFIGIGGLIIVFVRRLPHTHGWIVSSALRR
jgi:hypothetical protein